MIETERLIHRKFTENDLDRLIQMRVDNDAMKYLGGRKMQNPESLKKRLQFYISCYQDRDLGLHAMLWKETGEMIGWSGLQPLENSDEIEVGYGMIKEYWGSGIGYEAGCSWLKFGFEEVGLQNRRGCRQGKRGLLEDNGKTRHDLRTTRETSWNGLCFLRHFEKWILSRKQKLRPPLFCFPFDYVFLSLTTIRVDLVNAI